MSSSQALETNRDRFKTRDIQKHSHNLKDMSQHFNNLLKYHSYDTQKMYKKAKCLLHKQNVVSLPVFVEVLTGKLVKFPATTLTLKSYFVPGFK